MLDIPDLDIPNRAGAATQKGGASDVVAWQTGGARLLPRMPAGTCPFRSCRDRQSGSL